MITSFHFASIPHIIFGAGKLQEIVDIVPTFGDRVLFIIGGKSLKHSGVWKKIESLMTEKSINYSYISIDSEPSPILIDNAASEFRDKNIDVVIGIGGGSVTDAGKAISAMIPKTDSIKNYLEGVGTKIHDGEKIPYIAIPTTSGTGSEATKNAVISEIGPNGFKKSLRHNNLIPNYAIIDPELMVSCPSSISAACGMDAFTQLLEAYTSTKSNPMTDSLAYSGISLMKDALIPVCSTESANINLRTVMAYGSLMSGITLANAGLGIVHGLASPIGGLFHIPHGVVCGTLLAECTKINIRKLQDTDGSGRNTLQKYANIGALLEKDAFSDDIIKDCDILVSILENWTSKLKIDRLSKYGIQTEDIDNIIKRTSLKNNPIKLEYNDIKEILIARL